MPKVCIFLMSWFLVMATNVSAETVSLIGNGGQEDILVAAAMKSLLREEGYTVKSQSTDGVILFLSVMKPTNRQGTALGYVGHVSVMTTDWQNVAEFLVGRHCHEAQNIATQLKESVGREIILIDTEMGIGANHAELANILVTATVPKIKKAFRAMQTTFDRFEASKQALDGDVLNPIR